MKIEMKNGVSAHFAFINKACHFANIGNIRGL